MKRTAWMVAGLLLLSLAVAACGASPPGAAETQPSAVVAQASPLPTVASPLPTPTEPPTATPAPTRTAAPFQLVVLHTNDNWGETEPCG